MALALFVLKFLTYCTGGAAGNSGGLQDVTWDKDLSLLLRNGSLLSSLISVSLCPCRVLGRGCADSATLCVGVSTAEGHCHLHLKMQQGLWGQICILVKAAP